MNKEMFIIIGSTQEHDIGSGRWIVGMVDAENKAENICRKLKSVAVNKFKKELENGYEMTDSISIATVYDPNAHYTRYDSETITPYIEYNYVKAPVIDDLDGVYLTLVNNDDLPKSIKWNDDDTTSEPLYDYNVIEDQERHVVQ